LIASDMGHGGIGIMHSSAAGFVVAITRERAEGVRKDMYL